MNATPRFAEFSKAESSRLVCAGTRPWCLLVGALLVLLLTNLGNRGLNEPDEARYSDIAGEMLEAEHGWWEPRMSDFAHYDKPPMIYWWTASSFKIFGHTEWAARVPSLLGALMALAGIGWTAARLYGGHIAWWTVLFCGTLGQFWVLARMLTPDMLLTGFVTLAIGFWAEFRHRGGKGFWWWGCAWFWSLAWWTKATAALVPMLGLVLGLTATQDRLGLRSLRPLRLLLFVVLAGAPWYVEMIHRHPELKDFFLGRELAGRIVGHPDGRHGPIYYHVLFSLVGWLPWWPIALIGFFHRRREMFSLAKLQRWRALPLEAYVILAGLMVFSFMSSKLVTYTLPFAPWAALLCARMIIGRASLETDANTRRRALSVATGCSVLLLAVSFLLPRWESRMGLGSSLREVAQELHRRNASVAYLDRFMSGLEFYFGESVFYVTDRVPRQLSTDTGNCEALGQSHFLLPAELSARLQGRETNGVWFVRYKARAKSPLSAALQQVSSTESVRVGDFVLDHVQVTVAK
jgi:4-amino-4-deoxy-L-arabinose transferase-like glycosyltransferase